MRLWSEVRLAGWLRSLRKAGALAVLAWAVAGFGQTARTAMSGPSREGDARLAQTVSVASLRVPEEAWRHLNRAESAAQRNRPEEFEREAARALEIAPEFAEAHLLRAKVLVRAGRFAEALGEATAARQFDPGVPWAGVVLAGTYNGMHRFNDALLILNAQRGPEAESWQAKYERSRAEIGRGDAESALRWSARALQSAPAEFTDARIVRANALLLARRWSEALEQMDIYLESRGAQAHRAEVLAMRRAVAARMAPADR